MGTAIGNATRRSSIMMAGTVTVITIWAMGIAIQNATRRSSCTTAGTAAPRTAGRCTAMGIAIRNATRRSSILSWI